MEQNRGTMRSLLSSRVRKESKRDVSRLTLDEVLSELGYRWCALDKEPENCVIPRYPWDDAAVMADEREPELGEMNRATRLK